MFIVFLLLPSDELPEEVTSYHDTFEKALLDTDRMINYYGGARKLEIYDSPNKSFREGKLIASLRTIR